MVSRKLYKTFYSDFLFSRMFHIKFKNSHAISLYFKKFSFSFFDYATCVFIYLLFFFASKKFDMNLFLRVLKMIQSGKVNFHGQLLCNDVDDDDGDGFNIIRSDQLHFSVTFDLFV